MRDRVRAKVRSTHPAQQVVLHDESDVVSEAKARVGHLTGQSAALLPNWSLAPVVDADPAMRGFAFIVAVAVVAEFGDFGCFDNPRRWITRPGLIPSEHSGGANVRRGRNAKSGSGLERRVQI